MSMNIIDNSIIAGFLVHLLNISRCQLKRLCDIYKESKAYKGYAVFSRMLGISFAGSFLGRISEVREGYSGATAIDNSEFIKRLLNMLKSQKQYFLDPQTSAMINFVEEIRRGFYFSPLRIVGIIGAAAVSANTAFTIILQNKEAGLLWWLARIALLVLAVSGFYCRATLADLGKTSFFLSRIKKCCKIGN